MLIGQHDFKLHKGGRIEVPRTWWPDLAQGGVITRGLEPSLVIYPREEFLAMVSTLEKLSFTSKATRVLYRLVYGLAEAFVLDEKGGFVIPQPLIHYAAIEERGVMVGLGKTVEVWGRARWQETEKTFITQASSLAESVSPWLMPQGG